MKFKTSIACVAWGLIGFLSSPAAADPPTEPVPDYQPVADWPRLPESLKLGPVSAVATDSADRVYVLQRAEPPILAFDRDGNFLHAWGEGLLKAPHGLRTDAEDNVWATDTGHHLVFKFNANGETLLTLGIKDQPGDGQQQFNRPADVAVAPSGEFYVADGYGNARVVKFSPEGKFLQAWGRKGTAAGSSICRTPSAWTPRAACASAIARTTACKYSPRRENSSPSGRRAALPTACS